MGFIVLSLYCWNYLFIEDVSIFYELLRIDSLILSFVRSPHRKPPDPNPIPPSDWKLWTWNDDLFYVLLLIPRVLDRGYRWFYQTERKEKPLLKEVKRQRRLNRLLLLHLLNCAASLPTLDPVTSNSCNQQRIVDSTILGFHGLVAIQHQIAQSIHLLPIQVGNGSTKPVLQDSGASACTSPDLCDFEPNTLEDLPEPILMEGIGGGVPIKQAGIIRYDVLDDKGAPAILRCPGFYMPDVKQRLFSPQTYFAFHGKGGELGIRRTEAKLRLPNGQIVTMPLDPHTRLFYMHCLDDVQTQANELAFSLALQENSNLSRGQKQLLKYHHRLIHCAFRTIRHIGKLGWLGTRGLSLGPSKDDSPMCGTCNYGKQKHTPSQVSRTTPHEHREAAISKNKLEPGDLISMDHMVIRTPGRSWTSRGRDTEDRMFKAATVFVDSASKRVRIKFQRGLSAIETIQSKMEMERESLSVGRVIKSYRTDNGTFSTAQAMMENIKDHDQTITFSGAGAQHQNAVAESAIRTIGNACRLTLAGCIRSIFVAHGGPICG